MTHRHKRLEVNITRTKIYEWTGALLGLAGSFLLATNSSVSPFGWVAFFGANIAMVLFAKRIRAHGLFVQQLGFTATTLIGLYRWVGSMGF